MWTEAVDCVFRRYHGNGSLPVVWGKIGVLNTLYSTQLHFGNNRAKQGRAWRKTDDAQYKLARWVVREASRLDGLLDRGRVKAVRMLEEEHPLKTKTGRVRHLYSFATKFAHFHNPSAYPLWDSRTDKSMTKVNEILGGRPKVERHPDRYWYEDWILDVERVMDLIGSPDYREVDKALYTWNGGRWDD